VVGNISTEKKYFLILYGQLQPTVDKDYLAASLNFNIFRFALFSKFSNNGIGNDFVKPSGSHVLKF